MGEIVQGCRGLEEAPENSSHCLVSRASIAWVRGRERRTAEPSAPLYTPSKYLHIVHANALLHDTARTDNHLHIDDTPQSSKYSGDREKVPGRKGKLKGEHSFKVTSPTVMAD